MSEMINIGSLVADLDVNTTKLERGLANAQRALYVVKNELADLHRKFMENEISSDAFLKNASYLVHTQQALRNAMREATDAVDKQATAAKNAAASTKAMNEAMRRSNAAGMAIMQLGYAIDDVQYGFRSIVNNVAPFTYSVTTAFGLATESAMKWAAGIQVAAVAAYQLYNNWDQAMDLMGLGKVLTEAEEMDALAKNTKRTADETERLNRYKKEQKEILDLMESRPKADTQQEKLARDAVAEVGDDKATGGQKLAKALADSFRAQGLGEKMSPEEQAEIDKIQDRINGKAPVPTKDAGMFVGLGNLMAGGANAQGAATVPSAAATQAMKEKAEKELAQKQKEINERINKADDERSKAMANDAVKNVDDRRAAIRRLEPNPANKEIVDALKATLPENVMAKNLEKIWDKVKDKGQDALDHFFEEFKKKSEKAAKEEREFDENADRVFKGAVQDAKDTIPGADKIAKFHVAQAMLTGDPRAMQAARDQIQAELEKMGLNKGVAGKATDELFSDAEHSIKEDVIDEMLGGRSEKAQSSQQFDITELAARVQAGVGGDESKKHTSLMQKMVTSLANIEQAKGNIFGVTP